MEFAVSRSVATVLNLNEKNVAAVLELLAEGATIPFIARYRKDRTGALDEVQIQAIKDEAAFQEAFKARKAFIEKSIAGQEKMTVALQQQLDAAKTLNDLEDIYLPFKPKRKTKAQAARENGLEPLADWLLMQLPGAPEEQAAGFLTEKITDTAAALQGARDILAEKIAEDAELRGQMRHLFDREAMVTAKVMPGRETDGAKFRDYFDFAEAVSKIPSHRMLAVLRGFMEGFLRLAIQPEEEAALDLIRKKYLIAGNEAAQQAEQAMRDAYRRLLQPALESEYRMALKVKADEEAIHVFAENLRQLLLSAPLGSKSILAIDPGYRTGCKVVVLDKNGNLQHTGILFIHEKNEKLTAAENIVRNLVGKYAVESIAIGDGTAGRETEQFIKNLQLNLPVFLVNEDGASVYSASETAREEFPDQDITVRGAVSIGRRLMDPLAELVKIDPKSIGVGQYQHDVNQVRLKQKLDQTVISCVNAVGVNLNTAGKHLLQYVSGIGPALAENIVRYRRQNGSFDSRHALLHVERLGAKAFEQCAGFLRIKNGKHPLDASGVHPEAYSIVERMAADLHVPLTGLIGNESLIGQIRSDTYITDAFGKHTIEDILKELKKPGLDPRSGAQAFEFAPIYSMEDAQPGMIVPGIVTNLTRFGAFVDIGIKQDGLVHISEIAHHYISDPAEVLKLNQQVTVKILELDKMRKRISLSIKQAEALKAGKRKTPPAANTAPRKEKKGGTHFDDALRSLKEKFR